jgi:hypothetical protein
MLIDPWEAFAEQGSFVNALAGLAGLARLVRALADQDGHPAPGGEQPDEFVHLLLAVASLGDAVDRLAQAAPARATDGDAAQPTLAPSTAGAWLR